MGDHRTRVLASALGSLLRSELVHVLHRDTDTGRARRARQLRHTLEDLGPLYTKLGQMLSTRPDLVSAEVVRELRELHDAVSVQPFAVFEPVLRAELGAGWRARFRDLDTRRPLGAASLAQVYAATLPDGRLVAVKVQRPGIAPVVDQDMALLRRAARLATRLLPDLAEVVDIRATLRMLFDAMGAELDFTAEARQMDRARAEVTAFKHLDVPEVVLATPRVLVQSRAPGCSIRDADPAAFSTAERTAIGRDLLAYMYRAYFTTGVFHADPHPGNVFVHPGAKASLLDWGMVGRVDRRTSRGLLLMLLNIALNDGRGAAHAWIDMGCATARADVAAFQHDMQALVPTIANASLADLNFGASLTSALSSATRRGIRTSPSVAVLAKSFANLDGAIRHLVPELSLTGVLRDELRHIMAELLDDAASEPQLARLALDVASWGEDALRARAVLRDLADGQVTVRVAQTGRGGARGRGGKVLLAAAAAGYLWRTRRGRPRPTAERSSR
ncbi:ABC1 kinase family protein [Saccharothrix xinjiangensis]|uniref:ABC1 kinase family protein n=1 Tax=Saccharothrix xinjiangensis TaxID=204798 RepID=A0ABV9Y065_9PSEU